MAKKQYVLLKETTEWADNYTCNFTYVFEKMPNGKLGKAIAYFNGITDEVQKFRQPLIINMNKRTFKQVGI